MSPGFVEVNPLAAQHTKLAIKPNRTKWDTLLLDVLPKSVPHSRAAAKLQGLLRGARERRRGEPPGWYRKLNAEARARNGNTWDTRLRNLLSKSTLTPLLVGALGVVLAVAVAVILQPWQGSIVKDGTAPAMFKKSDPSWHVILLPTPKGARRGVQIVKPSPREPRPQLNSAEAVRQVLLSISLLTLSALPNVTTDYKPYLTRPELAPQCCWSAWGDETTCGGYPALHPLRTAVRKLHALDPDIGVRQLLAKLRNQQPELGAGKKEVREALTALQAQSEAAKAATAQPAADESLPTEGLPHEGGAPEPAAQHLSSSGVCNTDWTKGCDTDGDCPTPSVTASPILQPRIAPALGRGYSTMTNDVLLTCLNFTETSMPRRGNEQTMLEFTHDGIRASKLISSMEGSASWGFVRSTISAAVSAPEDRSKKHYVAARMPTERHSSMIDDTKHTTAKLMPDALALVQRGDLVGFFQACGSGYIRSIRRTAELAAVIGFSSASLTSSQEMAANLKLAAFGQDINASQNMRSISNDSKTTITVKGFGLSLNPEGADTLFAHNFEDYNNAVQFAQSANNNGMGMVYTIEVVPWASNLQFNNAVNFRAQEQMKRNFTYDTAPGGTCSVARDGDRQPVMVKAVEAKAITMMNAEFISKIDASYHKEMHTIRKFIACRGELSAMVGIGRGGSNLLDHTHNIMSARTNAESVTVAEAETILSPRQLASRKDSLKCFVEHFYAKCLAQISNHSNAGRMTKYWWEFNKCMPNVDGGQHSSDDECLDAGRNFKYEGNQVTCPMHKNIDQRAYGINVFMDRFCMPKINTSSTDSLKT